MPTQCSQEELEFGSSGGRKLVGAFDGGAITSNGGALLLGAVDRRIRLTAKLARCFTDHRLPDAIHHALPDLLRQRIFGLALGYEDLLDHDLDLPHISGEPGAPAGWWHGTLARRLRGWCSPGLSAAFEGYRSLRYMHQCLWWPASATCRTFARTTQF